MPAPVREIPQCAPGLAPLPRAIARPHDAPTSRGEGMTNGFEAHGLGKRYRRRHWALRDVDVAVPAGSITALVGPNGAGKSTMIKAGVGFERPTAGQVLVNGVDPWRERARAILEVGYVPQSPSLYRELTVDDHVALAASLRPAFEVDLARRRLDQLAIPL